MRHRLGLSTRQVAAASRCIAKVSGLTEFGISHAWIVQLESARLTPSLFKLYSLSAIYGVGLEELLSLYLDLKMLPAHHVSLNLSNTHVTTLTVPGIPRALGQSPDIEFPHAPPATDLLPHDNSSEPPADEAPLGAAHKRFRSGIIGAKDYRMSPLLRPGAIVQIDTADRQIRQSAPNTEFDRPLYFVELRTGYVCSWCDRHRDRLLLIPHPLSPCRVLDVPFPNEAEVVGRVTAATIPWGSETFGRRQPIVTATLAPPLASCGEAARHGP